MIVDEFKIGSAVVKIDDSCITDANGVKAIIHRLEAIATAALKEQQLKKKEAV